MNFYKFIILCIALQTASVFAEVKIALFSVVNIKTGEIVSPWPMYPEEQRHHAVIEINDVWYQMKPLHGVTKSKNLPEIMKDYHKLRKEDHNRQVEVFINSNLNLDDINIDDYKGIKFSMGSDWDDKSSSHCTKFIAKIMGYDPLPSPKNPEKLNLSPDDLYDILTSEKWEKHSYSF